MIGFRCVGVYRQSRRRPINHAWDGEEARIVAVETEPVRGIFLPFILTLISVRFRQGGYYGYRIAGITLRVQSKELLPVSMLLS